MSVRVSLRCMLRLISVDILRIVHNVGFLVGRLICFGTKWAEWLTEVQNSVHQNFHQLLICPYVVYFMIVMSCSLSHIFS